MQCPRKGSSRRAQLGAAFAVFAVLSARTARAQEACPERAAVWRAVTALASREHPTTLTLQAALSSVELEDLGPRYRVTVRDRTREYDDPERNCERRAQVAAVFVALVLSPTEGTTAEPAPEKVEPKPEAPHDTPVAQPRRQPGPWSVEGAAILAIAPHEGVTVLAPSAGIGVAWMNDRWGAALGARAPLGGGTFPMGAATAHFSRYPAYLGLRWRWHAAPFAGAIETSGMAAVLRMGQDGFPKATRVEGGVRLSAMAQLDASPLAPYIGVFSEWIPWPYPLALTPDGPLTHAPAVWFGVAAGISLSLN